METLRVRLIPKDELRRRLSRMVGERGKKKLAEVTLDDMRKWIGCDRRDIRNHINGSEPISDAYQLIYSRFFALLDGGELEVRIQKNGAAMTKILVRVPKPATPPLRVLQPRIDYASMRLKYE